ncbi:MAG: hypothetical protein IJQ31_01010 [Thermoguttaceae bacterium]|nr:hypothetical protein [Thermoguttaceae bacterium]
MSELYADFPKFHASLDSYMKNQYRELSSIEEVRQWMNTLLKPPKDSKKKGDVQNKAGMKLHKIYPDWELTKDPWDEGFLLDWIVLADTQGEKCELKYRHGKLVSDNITFDNIPRTIQADSLPEEMTIFGKAVNSNIFVAESMSAIDDILQFTMNDLLVRLKNYGFTVPSLIQSFDSIENVIVFLEQNNITSCYLAIDYLYYRECIGYSTKYPMWIVHIDFSKAKQFTLF